MHGVTLEFDQIRQTRVIDVQVAVSGRFGLIVSQELGRVRQPRLRT